MPRKSRHEYTYAGRKVQVDAVQIKLKPGMKLDDVIEQYVASAFDDQEIKRKPEK